jgi:hypothetical protein
MQNGGASSAVAQVKLAMLEIWHLPYLAWDALTGEFAVARFFPAWMLLNIGIFLASTGFWFDSLYNAGAAFEPHVWGAWACQFPAHWWANLSLVGSSLIIAGCIRPYKWKWLAGGSLLMIANFSALALSAIYTGGSATIPYWIFGFFIGTFYPWILIAGVRSRGNK